MQRPAENSDRKLLQLHSVRILNRPTSFHKVVRRHGYVIGLHNSGTIRIRCRLSTCRGSVCTNCFTVQCTVMYNKSTTKLVGILRNKLYEERLRILELTTLEKRRLRGDLVETYKIVTNKENIDPNQFFKFTEIRHNLRGHSLKLSLSRNTSRIRRTFFSQRVVTDRNRLPQHAIEAPSTNAVKTDLTSSGNRI